MSGDSSARDRILARVRDANDGREPVAYPGPLPRELEPPTAFAGSARVGALDAFEDRFRAAGGEVVRLEGEDEATAWLAEFAREFGSVAISAGVPDALRPSLHEAPPDQAELGVCMAVGAAAQTGSLLLASPEGRRPQLLPPVTLVWIRAELVHATLGDAIASCRPLPAALALHSGPSKSADIGQILVRGVHGPGRVVAAMLEAPPEV